MKWNEINKLYRNYGWTALEQHFDWVADMQSVVQDPHYHAEGNVAIHTEMVLKELEQQADYHKLDERETQQVWLAALMHDIEKRSTTRVEQDGSVTSAGHAKKGELTARTILYQDLATPFAIREQIAALVRYHGLPIWFLEKSAPEKALYEASLRCDMPLLSLLARADMLGRNGIKQADKLMQITLFDLACQETSCWSGAKAFSSKEQRFNYFYQTNSPVDYQPWFSFKSTVVMLSALPGMGKDHLISQQYADWPVISLDEIRRKHKIKPTDSQANGWVIQQAKEQAKIYLRKGISFVWNATNITRQLRQQLISLFVNYDAYVHLVYLEVPYKQWVTQNKQRQYALPEKVLARLLSKLEVPACYEAHQVDYLIVE